LSTRYSHSPALVLTVRASRIRRFLHALLGLAGAASLLLVAGAGNNGLVAGLSLAWCLLLARTGRDRSAGMQIHYQDCSWSIRRGSVRSMIYPGPAGVCLPGLIQFCWREPPGSRAHCIWLFADSAAAGELTALRRRLVLER
jgi:hypothetical protein